MAKAIIWCRVSTTEQEFYSQQRELVERAKNDGFLENDLIIIGQAGASAIKMNELYQKEVDQLLYTINTNKEVTTIYVWEVSRLARNEVAFYQMKETIIKSKVQFICKVPEIVLLQPNGEVHQGSEIILNLLVTLAKQEMEIKKKRFARGKQQKALENKFAGGRIPFGYKVNEEKGKLIEIDPDTSKIVRHIFDLYEKGFSQTQIAKKLQGTALNRPMMLSFVHNILINRAYTGEKVMAYSYERQYPMIITKEQFEHCREIAKNNNTSIDKAKRYYYASKILVCPTCGSKCGATGSKNYYFCYKAHNPIQEVQKYGKHSGVFECDNKITLSINILDSLLWHIASAMEATHILVDKDKNRKEYESKLKDICEEIELANKEKERFGGALEKLYLGLIEGVLKQSTYDKKVLEYNSSISKIDASIAEFERQKSHLQDLISDIDNDDLYSIKVGSQEQHSIDDLKVMVEKVREIEDDKIRYDLVHKHIMKVHIYQSNVDYKFNVGVRNTPMKRIEVYKYNGDVSNYYFIPFGGGSSPMFWDDPTKNPDSKMEIQYLARFRDLYKHKPTPKTGEMRDFYKITALAEELNISTYLVRRSIREGVLPTTFKFGTHYISKEDAIKYKERIENNNMPIDYVTCRWVADQLNLPINIVWEDIRNCVLPATKIARSYNIHIDAYEEYKKLKMNGEK